MKVLGWLLLVILVTSIILIAVYWQADKSLEELKPKWAPAPSQFVNVQGMQVHLRDEGPRDDPNPIVLIHGTSSSLHTWDGWTDELKSTRRVVRFDIPAFGLTGPSPDNNYTIESYASFIVAMLDHLNIEQGVLAGNSLGGYVAWATAVIYPDRVSQLALVDTSGYPFTPKSTPIGFIVANTPILNKLMEKVLPRSMIESSIINLYGDPSIITPELVDRYFDLTVRAGNRQALAQRFRQTKPGTYADKISTITQPTLIIWGGQDRLIPPELGDHFHREIPDSELVMFDELGHLPHEEAPLETVAVFKRFIAK
ncbi:alpha/beta hydrolase [Thalassotalea euphylliae]|uniref:Alpha/beta hydrolase n=1 Tax=Thalassotalea euphylliae TaxID=1655234 RepID=A0A3E0TQC6_9GAMM|nr:alpha/beta hydrolase [Thalassotalea euphylliae]REL26550.1 alpha/beta hydrolase [Thalassotalea euphylliae]